ncbi:MULTISPECIES: hypothetical protein [Nocardioides]|uniref:Uncharacterized protein n=1 Tax=Nocardioides vastitatis TaxID=2568655 RepID=A0ABW0ZD00_9ACTN|nr:hypothetical protein [Nocardioides sp.]THJ08622.1 hypothetical protein E7Z54_04100 [Nocardioides sp.]
MRIKHGLEPTAPVSPVLLTRRQAHTLSVHLQGGTGLTAAQLDQAVPNARGAGRELPRGKGYRGRCAR